MNKAIKVLQDKVTEFENMQTYFSNELLKHKHATADQNEVQRLTIGKQHAIEVVSECLEAIAKLEQAEKAVPFTIPPIEHGKGSFWEAIELAKRGFKVARTGWNDSGMFAYIVPAASYPAQTGAAKQYFGQDALVPYREYWALKTAQNDIATWSPSGSDSLANDWCIVD